MATAVADFFFGGMSLRNRFGAMLEDMREKRRFDEKYTQTFRELDRMTDRELHDIGISRGDIPQISHEAATTL